MLHPPPTDSRPPRTALGMSMGYMLASAVHAVAALGIADLLSDGPKSISELARSTGTHAPSLGRLMRALAASGVFRFEDSHFALNAVSQPLQADVPGSVREFVLNGHIPWQLHSWELMLASVRTGIPAFRHLTGKSLFEYLSVDPDEARRFDEVMNSHTRATIGWVLGQCRFAPGSRIVDVGGGDGTFLQAVLRAHPTCRGIVFDEGRVIERMRGEPLAPQIAARLEFMAGDFFHNVPPAADAYILKNVLHDWDDAGARVILRNCCAAMRSGARMLIIEMVLQPDEMRPYETMMDVGIMLITGGRERTEQELGELCREAGLIPEQLRPGEGPFSIIEVVKA